MSQVRAGGHQLGDGEEGLPHPGDERGVRDHHQEGLGHRGWQWGQSEGLPHPPGHLRKILHPCHGGRALGANTVSAGGEMSIVHRTKLMKLIRCANILDCQQDV